MRRRLTLALAAAAVLAALPACAGAEAGAAPPDAADWKAIKAAVGAQLDALRAADGERAFTFAAPGLRQRYGDARMFMAMVRHAYAPLLTAVYTEFLEGAFVDGLVVQPVRLIAADDTVQVALYTMERQPDGRWRIAGCMLAPSTVQAA
jgi:hypothetical protein